MNLELLAQLTEESGISGREERVRDLVQGALEGLVDEISTDALGNLIAVKRATTDNPNRERVMLSAHMDEIGFIVKHVDDNGFLRVHNVGGFDVRNLFARNVLVWTRNGPLPGILHPASKPIHLLTEEERRKQPEIHDLAVDLGLPGETVKPQVRIGDPVTLVQTFRRVGDLVTCKHMDDRVSVWIQIEALRALAERPVAHDIYAVFSTQEEVGLRGARTAAYHVDPTIGVALDVTLAVDTPGAPASEAVTQMGKGVAIKIMDSSMISTRWLVDQFIDLAEQQNIPYQLEILARGGTDGGAIQASRGGVPTLTLSIPTRYIHTVVEACHVNDLQATIDLLVAYLSQGASA